MPSRVGKKIEMTSLDELLCVPKIIPYCMENNIGFVPFSPIASGLLSGKITPQTQFERNDDVRNWVPQLLEVSIRYIHIRKESISMSEEQRKDAGRRKT